MTKAKKKSTPPKKSKTKPSKRKRSSLSAINVKLSPATLKELEAKAKKFTDGNLSALLRYAGLRYRPAKGEAIPFKVVL